MPKKRIFCVGCELPGEEFESVEFSSPQTLLDADIILFQPTFGAVYLTEEYNGQPMLSEGESFSVKQHLDHWYSEIVAAVNAGKLVIIFLAKPLEYFRYTGRRTYTGTGRNQRQTNTISLIRSYGAVPKLKKVVAKYGTEIRLEKQARLSRAVLE